MAVALGGCGDSSTSRYDRSSEKPRLKHDSITLYSWDEYIDPKVLTAFTDKTGIRVVFETFEDTDGIEDAVRAEPSRYDLIVFDGDKVEKFCELGLARELDHSRLPQFSNIAAKYRDLAIDPKNRHSVPYLWGTTLLAYRKDKIADPGDSWKLLWDAQYQGRVAMLNERIESSNIVLFKNGYSMNDRSAAAMAAAQDDLINQVTDMNVRYAEGAPSVVKELLGSGEVWAMAAYSGDAAMIADEDERIGMLLPKEGASMWLDSFVITRHSLRSDEAHAFIDFMLTPEIAAQNAEYLHYATPNEKALVHLDDDFRSDTAIFPPEHVLARCEFAGSLTPERERPLHAVWQKVMQRYHQSPKSGPNVEITETAVEED